MKLYYGIALALLLALAACSTTETPQTGAGADVPSDEPATGASENGQDNAAENSATQDTEAQQEFESLFAKRNLQWKIAYDLKSEMDGKTVMSQLTQYMKGEDRFRTDMMYDGTESRVYMVEETFTMCSKQDGDWQCFKTTPQEGDDSADVQDWETEYEQNEDDYTIVADGTKVVAGVSTKCFKVVDQKSSDSVVRYCFASDGAPLYIYFSGQGTTSEMIATSYSKSVSDSEFTPPAEAQDFGSMYGGAGTSPTGGDSCSYCNYLSGTDKDNCLASC
jgi:hypothetical protein